MTSSSDRTISAVLVICALITTSVVVYRQFFPPAPAPDSSAQQKPVFIEKWRDQLQAGVILGPPSAKVHLVEFADFECPFCGTFHTTLKALRAKYPDHVAVHYVHFPLSGHRFAEPAARAAECAGAQGRFEAMHDLLFDGQRELGLKPWGEFAAAAGVADSTGFESCMQNKAPMPRIVAGQELAQQLEVRGTPTLIVNGWKLARPPTERELERMITAVLAGRDPLEAG